LTDKVKMGVTLLTHQKREKVPPDLVETIAPVGSIS
jgi:hypothetical protein